MTPQRRIVVMVAGALAVIVLAWFMVVYRPKGAEIADQKGRLATAQAEEQNLRATLAQLEGVDEDRPEQEAEVRRLSAAIPPDPELAAFILAVHDQAGRANLEFASIAPALPAAQPGLAASVIAVTIQISGNFTNVLDFLGRLEDLDRLTVVDSISLTASEPEQEARSTGTAAAASTSAGTPVGSQPVAFQFGDGAQAISVTTDAATVAQVGPTTTTTPGRVTAFLLQSGGVTQIPSRLITVALSARLFTTAVAATGETGAVTTTTTVPGATTTTTAGG